MGFKKIEMNSKSTLLIIPDSVVDYNSVRKWNSDSDEHTRIHSLSKFGWYTILDCDGNPLYSGKAEGGPISRIGDRLAHHSGINRREGAYLKLTLGRTSLCYNYPLSHPNLSGLEKSEILYGVEQMLVDYFNTKRPEKGLDYNKNNANNGKENMKKILIAMGVEDYLVAYRSQ